MSEVPQSNQEPDQRKEPKPTLFEQSAEEAKKDRIIVRADEFVLDGKGNVHARGNVTVEGTDADKLED